jgi:S-layer homology domain.
VSAGNPKDYTDIKGHFAYTALQAAISNDILLGYNHKISPNNTLKRSEMATIIARVFGASEKAAIAFYTDVPKNALYADSMAKALQMGIISGEGNKLRPEEPITREEAFTILAKAFELTTQDLSSLDKFNDKNDISEASKPYLAALVASGYASGSNGKIKPKAALLRWELAQIFYKMTSNYIKAPGTYKKLVSGNVIIRVPHVTLKDVTIKGDLIIGDGVGKGDITLDNVVVTGRTVVRGGGINSIHVVNGTDLNGTVIIDNVNNQVRMVTDLGTSVQDVYVGSAVLLEGTFGIVNVIGANDSASAPGLEVKGTVQSLSIDSNTNVTIDKASEVKTVSISSAVRDTKLDIQGSVQDMSIRSASNINVSGTVTNITVNSTATGSVINTISGAKISSVAVNATTSVTGEGTVTSVTATANDVRVDTIGTNVVAGTGTTGVTARGTQVAAGTSMNTSTSTSKVPIILELKESYLLLVDECYRMDQPLMNSHLTIPIYSTPSDANLEISGFAQGDGTIVKSVDIIPNTLADIPTSQCSYLLDLQLGPKIDSWGAWFQIIATKEGYESTRISVFIKGEVQEEEKPLEPAIPDQNGPAITVYGVPDQAQEPGTFKAIPVYTYPSEGVQLQVTSTNPSVAAGSPWTNYGRLPLTNTYDGFPDSACPALVEIAFTGYGETDLIVTALKTGYAPSTTRIHVSFLDPAKIITETDAETGTEQETSTGTQPETSAETGSN